MTAGNKSAEQYKGYIEKRIRAPLVGRGRTQSVGLTQIAGTHGTQVRSVVNLSREGRFSGGAADLRGTFHITPNLRFNGWKKTSFADDISTIIGRVGLRNPLAISQEYAETGPLEVEEAGEDEENEFELNQGVVIAFDRKVLELVRGIDIDEVSQEPEVILAEAPPLESVRAIYPVDDLAQAALMKTLGQ